MRRIIFAFLCLLPALTCQGRIIYVDANGSGDYPTIQEAIDDSNHGDTIVLTPGTYTGNGNRDIYFDGKAITVRSTNPNDPNIIATTIIDCNGAWMDGHRGFHFQSGEDANSILDGLTIRNGLAWGENGGGILIENSGPTIRNCVITNNSAEFNMIAGGSGGGICCKNKSNPEIISCSIIDNSAAGGGGVFCWDSAPIFTDCIISNNLSDGSGGGMRNYEANSVVIKCRITGNSAPWGFGGGISNEWYANPILTNCEVIANTSYFGGGVFCGDNSNATIHNCTIAGNKAEDPSGSDETYGGGIFSADSSPAVSNCTIAGNYAGYGGAMSSTYSSIAINNCIFWGNSNGQVDLGIGSSINIIYSDIQGGWSGVGNIDADPCFVQPGYWADANDPNIIVEPNDPNALWIEGDYHLYPLSLCINAGDPNYVPEPNETDLDGNPRVINGRIDMGAYEANHIKARLWILPRVINRQSKQRRVMAWLRLPQGTTKDQIDSSPLLLYPGQIEPARQFIFQRGRRRHKRTNIIAFFDKAELMAAVPNGPVELWAVGQLKTGRYFFGSDTIRIITRPRRPRRH